jgi:rhomboid protease GluP
MNCRKYHPTIILIAINVAIYIYGAAIGGNALYTPNSVVLQWGQVNALVLYNNAYYQLFTSMFIHASIFHLVGNMLFLFIFGLRGEEIFSLPEFLGIYLVGGLIGNVLSLAFGPGTIVNGVLVDPFISVGASGAIFALFGACIIYVRRSIRQSILGAFVYGFFLLLFSAGPGVNDLAHIGGLIFGLLIGYLLASMRKPHEQYMEPRQSPTTLPF